VTARIHPGVPFPEYVQWPHESATKLKRMRESPRAYKWWADNDRPDSDTLRVGRAVHTAVLEPHLFRDEYAVYEGKVRRGKEYDAFLIENQGKTPLTRKQFYDALQIAKSIHAHGPSMELLHTGQAEVSITWQHERTKLDCKARVDWRTPDTLVDLKTCRSPSPGMFATSAARLSYPLQLAFYSAAVFAATGTAPAVKMIAAQNQPPWDVCVFDVPEDVLMVGEREYELALDKVRECRESGQWPGIMPDGEKTLRMPAYYGSENDDDEELTFNGDSLEVA
jgi:hypothetical protein